MRHSPSNRPGYTLLEVLLASAIALFLLAGLYVAMDITLVRMDITREMVARGDLARAVANRFRADAANVLGPLPPKSGGQAAGASDEGSAAADAPAAPSSGSTGASSGSTPPPLTGGGTGSGSGSGDEVVAVGPSLLPLGLGVVGTESQVTLFCSRVPQAMSDADAVNSGVPLPGDLVRICYYLASDGSGLCRQERPWVTADGVGNATEPDRTDELADLLAPEVVAVTFEYYDGGSWASQWDGAVTDLDGVALTGPPRAIRMTMTIQSLDRGGVPVQRQVTHTVPVRAAVGNFQPPLPEPETPPEGTN